MKKKIVLASTSSYRRELLARLGLPFDVVAPGTDETPWAGESCAHLAERLAIAKAEAGGRQYGQTNTVIIGSDQVADLDGLALGKPGNRARAMTQLQMMRGKNVVFHTALAVHDTAAGQTQSTIIPTLVTMRQYTDRQIAHYLDREPAFDCAGSAKSEGLGTALIARIQSDDPTALIGMPLIALTDMLAACGIEVLGD